MSDKFTIINLLNKLAVEQKLTWRIKSVYANGVDKNLLEILIMTMPDQRHRGKITFHSDSGRVQRLQYKGFSNNTAVNIVDMLLDVINFEKQRKAVRSTQQTLC